MSLDTYTAQVALYSLFIGMLVSTVLLGMIFILHESFKSKRPEDLLLEQGQARSARQKHTHVLREQKARMGHKKAA